MRPLSSFIDRYLRHPLAKHIPVDRSSTVAVHRKIIESKPLLQYVYTRWYEECLPAYEDIKEMDGDIVEIGSGAGFLEKVIPGVIKSDVVETPFVNKVLDATDMDLEDNSLKGIFLHGVFHHIRMPGKFLSEAQRCLKQGGRLVMVEPHNTFIQRFLTKRLEHYEYFDDKVIGWENQGAGRMTGANMALPWVIFVRDRKRFEKKFPGLRILSIKYHTFISLVVTGGLSYKSFLPAFFLPVIELIEFLARPFMPIIGTTMTIDIEKL